jgi:beta-lactam-binding protein with PASTA domain/tRNA A-37 threonylcarbamoyl transferase component Bud32
VAPTRLVDQIGRVLGGRYRLLAPIGTGASAHVFLAEDVSLRRRVAVKVLHPALADDDGFVRRFRAEARASAALSHPNVMAVFDWGDDGETLYLVCEHLGGGSLRAVLDRGHRLTPSQGVLVGLEAARGLDYAHRRGLVHRDVKPANLLFDDDGRLRIADFGIARALAEAAWTEPAGAMLGTVRYASPEQVQGVSIDGRADVYALAVVLVEAVTGEVPFAADTTIATLMARMDTPLVAPESMGPLREVVERAGQPAPGDRPDAAEFGRALERAAHALPAPSPLPLAGSVVADDTLQVIKHDRTSIAPRPSAKPRAAAASSPPAELSPEAPGRRRRRWPWLLVALLATVAIGIGGAYAWVQANIPTHAIPTVVNLTEKEAVARLQPDFKVRKQREFVDGTTPGQVTDQNPDAGVTRKEGSTITLTVSKGPSPVRVPPLKDLDQAAAQSELEKVGLRLGSITPTPDENVVQGRVLDWSPKGNTLPKGTAVTLIVSGGPAPRTIDNFAGMTYDEAALKLTSIGLKPVQASDFSDSVTAGRVIRTEPSAGATAPRDSAVKVFVSKGPDLVAVPPIKGLSVQAATAALDRLGLGVSNIFGPPSKRVFDSDPLVGTHVRRGSNVSLYTR